MLNKDQGGGPKVVLATLASLEAGLARQLFIEWARDSRNLIVFPLQAQVQSSRIDSPGQQQHGGREGGGIYDMHIGVCGLHHCNTNCKCCKAQCKSMWM